VLSQTVQFWSRLIFLTRGGICAGKPNVAPPWLDALTKTGGTTSIGMTGIARVGQRTARG